ncbi:hypothetical protein ACEWX5_03635 [Helicobacter pylori]|uniref:hypothetical protein n=1 Tax=Helicobacter pylori TaxID=210 RepID=UPI0035A8FE53
MRQKNETATSFNQLKEITQIMQAQKTPTPKSENANTSEITNQSVPKPKGATRTKNHALKPTKRAFSERQITTIKDNSQASEQKRLKPEQANKNLRAEPSDEDFKQGLATQQRGQE